MVSYTCPTCVQVSAGNVQDYSNLHVFESCLLTYKRLIRFQHRNVTAFAMFVAFCQINVFLNRLNGPAIGISVLGIFVIDSNTILTVFILHVALQLIAHKQIKK